MTVIFLHNANQDRAREILGCHGNVEDLSVLLYGVVIGCFMTLSHGGSIFGG
jgi:hypothetical protein